jgi:translation elongation factor EF-Tu-like GTPase
VEDQAAKREAIKKKIQKLSDKRDKYIQEKQKDNKDSFDAQVGSFLKVQAKEKGLEIK